MYYDELEITELVGKTLKDVYSNGEEVIFTTIENEKYKLYHEQDCCESVSVETITEGLELLINSPILSAQESQEGGSDRDYESFTRTKYKLSTALGVVEIIWLGTSNGYYSEGVSFSKI